VTLLTTAGVCVAAYIVGSIPSGYLLVRAFRKLDVREYGSHNVGAINVFRVGGAGLGSLTLLADVAKALMVVLIASAVAPHALTVASAAFLVMVGHAYSGWFLLTEHRFSEGKSVACCLGCLIGLAWTGAIPSYVPAVPVGVWAAGLLGPRALTGRWCCISPATMAAAVSVPVAVLAARPATPYVVLAVAMAALVLVRHKNNIKRLLAGTEPRLGQRVSVGASSSAAPPSGM
jgi:glycerol-3-phosphate acyltransferase PlsY